MLRIVCVLWLPLCALQAQTRIVPRGDSWLTIAPEQPFTAAVQVVNAEGAPRAGYAILFARPGALAQLDRATTNDEGIAELSMTAPPTAGPFPVEVLSGTEPVSTVFAVTVTGSPAPPVDAATARGRVPGDAVQGPYLLPAGAVVRTGPGKPLRTMSSATWIAWEDTAPFALFEHTVRIHLVNAENPDAPVDSFADLWWPEVRPAPDQRFASLRGWRNSPVDPAFLNAGPGQPSVATLAKAEGTPPRGIVRNPGAVAVIVHGGDEAWQLADVLAARQGLIRMGLAPENIITNTNSEGVIRPVSGRRFEEMMTEVGAKGGTHLYTVMVGHGADGSITFTKEGEAADGEDGNKDIYGYGAAAKQVKRFADAGIPTTTIIMSCQAGSAISIFHQAVIPQGEMLTASDPATLTSYFPGYGGYYIGNVFEGAASDGITTMREAHAYALQQNFFNRSANAQHSYLAPRDFSVQNVHIDLAVPSSNPGGIRVTRPPTAEGELTIVVTVENTDIAAFTENPQTTRFVMPAGGSGIAQIPIYGRKEGTTNIRVRAEDSQRKTWGTTVAQVTVGPYRVSSGNGFGLEVDAGKTAEYVMTRFQPGPAQTLYAIPGNAQAATSARVSNVTFAAGSTEAKGTIIGNWATNNLSYFWTDSARQVASAEGRVRGYGVNPTYIGTSTTRMFREGELDPTVVRFIRSLAGTPIGTFSSELRFAEGAQQAPFDVTCLRPGEMTFTVVDTQGRQNPAHFICPSSSAEAARFLATTPWAFLPSGYVMAADMGWGNSAGALLPHTPIQLLMGDGSVRSIAYDPAGPQTYRELCDWAQQPKYDPEINFASRQATVIEPGQPATLYTNAQGFVRVLFIPLKEGTFTLSVKTGTLPPVSYPIRAVAPLGPPPEEMVVTPVASQVRVGTEIPINVQVNRTQRPLLDAIVTYQSRNSNVRLLDGTVTTAGTTSQQRTNSLGRSTMRFRVERAGPIDIGIFTGQFGQDIKVTAVP